MTLRGAVIGCGFFAQNHLHAWAGLEGAQIVAVCDLDAERAGTTTARFGIPHHYTDAAEMLVRERPDFVDIVTTVESHRALVELAASHGVPAICQKPFATTLEEAEAMVAACARADIPLMVHENFRWQAPLLSVAAEISSGRVGRPFFGRISFRHDYDVYSGQPYLAKAERFAILDVGVHLLDVARALLGEVRRLTCTVQRINPTIRGEDVATILLEHEDGTTSIVDCSFSSHLDPNPFPETLVEIEGDLGCLRLSPGYHMQVVSSGSSSVRDVDAVEAPWMKRPWHVVQDSVVNIQRHWIECLEQGKTPATSGRDNVATLRLALAAYESAERGKTIEIVHAGT